MRVRNYLLTAGELLPVALVAGEPHFLVATRLGIFWSRPDLFLLSLWSQARRKKAGCFHNLQSY